MVQVSCVYLLLDKGIEFFLDTYTPNVPFFLVRNRSLTSIHARFLLEMNITGVSGFPN
jgi:hypothetical protein